MILPKLSNNSNKLNLKLVIKYFLVSLTLPIYLILSVYIPQAYEQAFLNLGHKHVFLAAGFIGSGTTFSIKAPSGITYLLSNRHVCENDGGSGKLMVRSNTTGRIIPRKIIETSSRADLCLLEGMPGLEGMSLGSSAGVDDIIYSVGYSLGQPLNLTSGRVKAVGGRAMGELSTVDTSLSIYKGASGSPVFNIYGNVVGIVFATNTYTSWGTYLPVHLIEEFISPY